MSESSNLYRALSVGAFVTGLAAVAWVASGFVGTSAFALGMTLLIGVVYLGGAWELRRFSRTTLALQAAMADVPQPLAKLSDWLERVPAPLQGAVRQRVEAERGGFPVLALTPYLIGLLVMLGMLGTFLGMVVTFKGAVFALEGSADLSAIRSALAAPIKGLGLSFGTSVAGVATSAMLGLMTTLARRERTQALRAFDALVSTTLRPFSAAHQRQQSFEALQRQAEAMPAAARHLQTLIEQMEQRSHWLDEQLLARQADFQREAVAAYTGLAQSVERSLRESLAASARAATDSLQPVVRQAMSGIAAESLRLHEGVSATVQLQLTELAERFAATTTTVTDSWAQGLARHEQDARQLLTLQEHALSQLHAGFESRAEQWLQKVQAVQEEAHSERSQMDQARQLAVIQALEQTASAISERSTRQLDQGLEGIARLVAQTEDLVQARAASEAAWVERHGQRMDELAAVWRQELVALREAEVRHQQQLAEQQDRWQAGMAQQLQALRSEESARGDAAVQRLTELQSALATQLATLGAALEAPMARLMQTASEAPRAAAEVIAQLREQMGRLAERDNATLAERADLVGQIGELLQQVQQTTAEQRAAIESLVGSASNVLERVGQQFADTVGAQSGRAEAMAEQAAASTAQLGALGEAFQKGTQQLAASHEQLVHGLQQVEQAIGQSLSRSDEQLAYYVAQAREVIDLSISAQQGIVEDLRRLRGPAKAVAGAA